ncbi:CocE/NonD family hydrolase [Nocardioides antri]|uniref:ABC transporter ATP-binding protein n=1 Tax=Nocardioides antri TaxID=2607659 RepID=A0A5B1M0N3_9ACTN|nr:CocE/NonD family hydrolase [Nocardioides antri]KAA1426018.1 ABC transporter ATP-binding protein [Nocardioides antri]
MRHLRLPALLGLLLALLVLAPTGARPAGAAPAYTVTTLHFKVVVGPNDDQVCDIVGDVYVPAGATSTDRVPAILTTNGFGGSKDDQTAIGKAFASRGYVVLSYSGLGFGGSSCKITLDDPDWDGKAGRQLVSYLGGGRGIAYLDAEHTRPAPRLDVVVHDPVDHRGTARAIDPRVGTLGGSYGGGFQFATASVDPRVDTLVPLVTWNDLSYSLAPNNTDRTRGVSSAHSGSAKQWWAIGFSLLGLTGDQQNGQVPPDALPCPNFADFVCPALVTAGTTGYLQPGDVAHLRHASVASYIHRIRAPVLLVQGQNDTLFNLNEAIATYQALEAQGTEVKMIWQSWGHSGPAAPGEIDLGNPVPSEQYETGRILHWLDHYLKDATVGTGPEFAYFRDWVSYTGNARPAYAASARFPVGTGQVYRLSGAGDLVSGTTTEPGSQSFLTTAAGAPTGLNTLDVLGSYVGQPVNEVTDLPGTFAAWQTSELTEPVTVVGKPTARLEVEAPTAAVTQAAGEAGMLVLYVKVADVGPDGKARLIRALEAPVRIPDVTKPFTVEIPAIVHRFEPGHRIRLIVAGGSVNYRGGLEPTPVTIDSGPRQTLTLPVVR